MAAVSAIIAVVLFVLAAFGVHFSAFNIVDMGLAFVALTLLLMVLPVPTFVRRA